MFKPASPMKLALGLGLAASALCLAACGQAGPLYLPENAPPKSTSLLKKRKARVDTTGAPAAPAPTSAVPAPAAGSGPPGDVQPTAPATPDQP